MIYMVLLPLTHRLPKLTITRKGCEVYLHTVGDA